MWRDTREQAIEKFVGGLREKAKVEEDLAMLDQVKVDLEAPAPDTAGGGETDPAAPEAAP